MSRQKDVRDRLIEAALRYASHEQAIRSLTRRMHEASCSSSPPCWLQDDGEAWKHPLAEIPESYCDNCMRSTILARERHALKLQRGAKKETLLRAAAIFKRSIHGACWAGPAAGSGGINRDQITGGVSCNNSPSSSVSF